MELFLYNHGSQFRSQREDISEARVRLDLAPGCLLCSLHAAAPGGPRVTHTPLRLAPQQPSPEGLHPWADHEGTLALWAHAHCSPLPAANLRDYNPWVVPGTKSTPRIKEPHVLLSPPQGQTAEIPLTTLQFKSKTRITRRTTNARQSSPKVIATKLCITFLYWKTWWHHKSLTRGPSVSGIWQVRNSC